MKVYESRDENAPVEVHELEEEDAALRAHGDAEGEHEDADADGEDAAVLEQVLRPVVHDPGHKGLHVAELGVDSKHLEYVEYFTMIIGYFDNLIAQV